MKRLLSPLRQSQRALSVLAAGALIFGAGCSTEPDDKDLPSINPGEEQQTPASGQYEFTSADGSNGQRAQENTEANNDSFGAQAPEGEAADADGRADNRTVEEGDIYRVIPGTSLILNLNAYRGLQIIDFSDPTSPEIIGRAQVTGSPVEMYQVGDQVFVLLNNWRTYWTSRHDSSAQTYQGGAVISIDVSDKLNPVIGQTQQVPGWIRSSRLTRGNGQEALFVVSNEYNGGGVTQVTSFAVSTQGDITKKSNIDLGGYVADIQATPQHLIVARNDYSRNNNGQSSVSLIDISNPSGEMIEGGDVLVEGRVQNKYNMDIQDDILRVVSGNNWSTNTNTNHVQTFDASDIQSLTQLDHETFGSGMNLFATLFMDDRAFFVTYRRVDPFHAFSIGPNGDMTEESEFIVSGWNDFFRPVENQTRLIGIGKNDENGGATMAVSLYDITDLKNPHPLLERAEVELDWSWSEANWDDRAFTVLEKAVNVQATGPSGPVTETGLVLLPFSGWNDQEKRYVSAVQIYTFSRNTLTKRGTMEHGSQVRRSFVADRTDSTTGNLSEAELSLFDTTDPDQPAELGRVELAPNYSGFTIFGNHGVRHHDRSNYYGWWWGRGGNQHQATDSLQIVPLSGDIDHADAVAEISVPPNSTTYKAGDKLVVVSSSYDYQTRETDAEIAIWDLSDPANPTPRGTYDADDLPLYSGYYGYYDSCFDCGRYYGGGSQNVHTTDDALIVLEQRQKSELQGTRHVTYTRPKHENYYWNKCYNQNPEGSNTMRESCTYHRGSINCSQLTRVDGTQESEVCHGKLYECTRKQGEEESCDEVTAQDIPVERNEHEYEQNRNWSHYVIHTLDLSDPDQPRLLAPIEMPEHEEATGALLVGEELYLNHRVPVKVEGDSRPFVRYFFRSVDFADSSNPVQANPINIPGQLLAVEGDRILTRDFLWGETIVESSINKLRLNQGRAYLEGVQRFEDQIVRQVMLDGTGYAIISHQNAYYAQYDELGQNYQDYDYTNRMTIVDVTTPSFDKLSTTDVDDWANLQDARSGRVLYQVPGGLLVMDITQANQPEPQAYYPTRGWPRDIVVEGDEIFFSAGMYGLYRFDIHSNNLSVR